MTDTDQQKRSPKWSIYVLSGCGVLLLLAVIAVVSLFLAARASINRIVQDVVNPKPIVRTSPYHFGYSGEATRVNVNLPGKYGILVYQHYLSTGRMYGGEGTRAVLLMQGDTVKQEWPLPYSHLRDVRVGVYWYPGRGTQGPILRFYDATGESALDFGCSEVGQIARSQGRVFLGYYEYNDQEFRSGLSESRSSTGSVTYYSADGTPANDITSLVSPDNCTYLGSIVRKGNKLAFVPNPKK